ncbi:hypothetical protein BDR06DRAFT_978055 [Suillus hirtellus]|nr:hypothetical protein BDR06DRAFT_978055 [Suillus hirtellus]
MLQQGLTANASCRAIGSNQTQYIWNTNNSYVIYANTAAPNNSIAGLRLWNITANCGANLPMMEDYVTRVDASGNAILLGSGFLPSISLTDLILIAIISQGFYKYKFLDASICEVVPLLTTVHTKYSNELISSEVYKELFLRSGFMVVGSFPDNTIPDYLSSLVDGTIILQARKDNGGHKTIFNVSNTLHLIMASTAGNLALRIFIKNGIIANEGTKVQLQDNGTQKMFVKADQKKLV